MRALRGTAAAAIATTLASTGHTFGGGAAPSLWLLVAVTVLAAPLAVAMVGRRRSLPRLAAAIATAQIALHTAFAVVGGAAPVTPAGHEHVMPGVAIGVATTHAGGHLTAAMLIGHLVAALVTIALVAYGERLLAMIARGVRRLLARAAVTAPGPRPRAHAAPTDRRIALPLFLLSALRRRGPPAFAR
ncbi:hypothetical protein IC744_06405 [Microbacterium hominis]|uniref:Uncharacterized protein n=1 Tax=Microbacterium hominis TaxID=162426 RepID=A0A2K9DJN4_9MICO|nr:hypothetical protein CXR34_12930 [Microbacterium hominis]QOC27288.1 hypothetical protein IC745_00720 [Microbacterium hominis]QOC30360.1 hypothetical protein IC744_06405 [Microbacterium hominis]QYF99437.1 hypothetical protein KY498_16180 [Microbacterium sp. PAMC21962]